MIGNPGASAIATAAGGRLRGARSGGALRFLGVPYARPPERFAPPQPAPAWSGVRDALRPGCACPQPDRLGARFTHGELPPTSEDCLTLCVHTPSLHGRRPVLVWLHGGAFAVGHAGASIYDGSRLAVQADAVVVSVNYRLGSLGWLWHPALAPEPDAPAGNWGLLDQIAALAWVRKSIAAFGGDPDRVTVAGHSAGALTALDLLVAPAAAGLFRRVIAQSPPLADVAQPQAAALRWAQALSRAAGGAEEREPERLRRLPAGQLVDLHEALLAQPEFLGTRGAVPTIDAATLPRSPLDDPGARGHVDVLIGSTAEEGTFFFNSPWRPAPAPERIPAVVARLAPGCDAAGVLERYRSRAAARGGPQDELALLVEIATDALVAGPLRRYARARAAALAGGGRVYVYRCDHPGAGSRLGATHTSEVPLLFGTWQDGGPGERLGGAAPGAGAVARALREAWGRFLHEGDPGWAPLGTGEQDVIGIFGGSDPFRIGPSEAAATAIDQ